MSDIEHPLRDGLSQAESDASALRASIPDAVFPILMPCYETPHYTSSEYNFRKAFLANKPEKMTWFAYDVTITSPTSVTFTVFGMRDNCYGGIGKRLDSFDTCVDGALTAEYIEKKIRQLARQQREDELEAEEARIVASYADKIRADFAKAMETGTAKTEGLGAKHDSAGRKALPETSENHP